MLLDAIGSRAAFEGRWLRKGLALGAGFLLAAVVEAAPVSAPDILKTKCAACHMDNGKLQRIEAIRKTPEGWEMSIARMQIWHKVQVSREERLALVKYLSDRQGIAPSEASDYRFLLERRPNSQDRIPDTMLGEMCGRCHSFGRVALQRRDADEWKKLVHTHLGQFPSIEYSAQGRDRDWRDIALNKMVPMLAARYPKDTVAWNEWSNKKHSVPAGKWKIAGRRPGVGDYVGTMRVAARGPDHYNVDYELDYANGRRVSGRGQSIIYSGYEWRGEAMLGDEKVRSVFSLSEDGRTLRGRWFLRGADEIGASFEAVPDTSASPAAVLAVYPSLLKVGSETTVSVHGVGLDGNFDLGPGIKIMAARKKSAGQIELKLHVAEDAPVGLRHLRAKGGTHAAQFAVYRQFDSIRVEPEFGVARVGAGVTAAVAAQFEAVAYLNGPDGKPGTADDLRLGYVDAKWRVDNYDEKAKSAEDVRFAGTMQTKGLFLPAAAGPNPERNGLNNVGNLSVIAAVSDGERTNEAKGRLMVTVQRWNTPPLR